VLCDLGICELLELQQAETKLRVSTCVTRRTLLGVVIKLCKSGGVFALLLELLYL
jgi:hypothetical protein